MTQKYGLFERKLPLVDHMRSRRKIDASEYFYRQELGPMLNLGGDTVQPIRTIACLVFGWRVQEPSYSEAGMCNK